MFLGKIVACVIEARQVVQAVVVGGGHYPGIAAVTQGLAESVVVLEYEGGMRAHCGVCSVPIYGWVRKADVEICYQRLPVDPHVGGRREVSAFNVLQFVEQRLLRRAAVAGVPLDRALIDHDCKSESRVVLGRRHHKLRRLIDGIAGSVPVDNYPINAAAHHVVNLVLDLRRVGLAVTDIHMIGLPKP